MSGKNNLSGKRSWNEARAYTRSRMGHGGGLPDDMIIGCIQEELSGNLTCFSDTFGITPEENRDIWDGFRQGLSKEQAWDRMEERSEERKEELKQRAANASQKGENSYAEISAEMLGTKELSDEEFDETTDLEEEDDFEDGGEDDNEEEEDSDDDENLRTVWVWRSESSETTCDDCASLNGDVFSNEEDLPDCPVHPNCNCWIEEKDIDEDGNAVRVRKYEKKKRLPKDMTLSERGMEFLIRKEGRKFSDGKHFIYDDQTGKRVQEDEPLPPGATIGYGHLIKEGEGEGFRGGLTEQEAQDLFRQDIQDTEKAVQSHINTPIAQNQYDALVSLTYNIGTENLKNSTIGKYINNSELQSRVYATPEDAWKAWNKSQGEINNGLINRRNADWDLYKNGTY